MPWGWENSNLSSKGSLRIIKKYLLFGKRINGEKKRGWCIILQKANIAIAASIGGVFDYNTWTDIEFLDTPQMPPLGRYAILMN